MQQQIRIRQATINDAPLIAEIVAMAIADEKILNDYCGENPAEVLKAIAASPNTQYSYQNTLIATSEDDTGIGAIIGYDGAKLSHLRKATLQIVRAMTGKCPQIADETQAGEFYIDTLGVLPLNRSKGIATQLISAICLKAFSEGHKKVGLIADLDNIYAIEFYKNKGFQPVGSKTFFTHEMLHLQISQNDTL